MKVIGYGPVEDDRPFYPAILVLQGEESKYLFRDESFSSPLNELLPDEAFQELIEKGKLQEFGHIEYKSGFWFSIEEDGVRWFPASETHKLRSERAKILMEEGKKRTISDPLESLRLLSLAGKLAGTDVKKLIKSLEEVRKNDDETLDELFERNPEKAHPNLNEESKQSDNS